MQVFKAYFKIIKSRIVGFMIFLAIFIALSLLITSELSKVNTTGVYSQTKSYVAFYNMDTDSTLVNGLKSYLQQNALLVDIPDDWTKIQDALFFSKVAYVLRVPDGFTQDFMSGKQAIALDKMTAAGSIESVYLDNLVNKYLNTAGLYIQNVAGISQAQLTQNVAHDLSRTTSVTMKTSAQATNVSNMSNYFRYFAYVILAVILMGVTSFMMVFNEPNIYSRNLCSPLKPSRMNQQILAGNALFGVSVWAVLCAVVFVMQHKGIFELGTLLLCLNALVFTVVALSIAFLAGKFVKTHGVVSAVTNVLSLGICFLSGVFVDQELLGKTVLRIASFNPGYWYVKAVHDIRDIVDYNAQTVTPVVYSMLVQLGFAVALFVIAMVVTKQKKVTKSI